jgi:ABC-type glycerol-3-phosphate transport system permease component
MKNKSAQVSVEYLIVLGIALFLLAPLIVLFNTSSQDTKDAANSKLIVIAGTEIISNAEKVYYQGRNSRIKLDLNLPSGIEQVNVSDGNKSLVFVASTGEGFTDFVFFSDVPLSMYGCTGEHNSTLITGGTKELFVESCGNNATIYVLE